MDNILLIKENEEINGLCKELGFTRTLFLDDVSVVGVDNKEKLRKAVNLEKKKGKFVIFKPKDEVCLRYALERTGVDLIYGMEEINPKDSMHFVRGGLDQIVCKIAKDKNKIIGFSFSEILNSKHRGKLLGRVRFNLKLCRKYKVKVIFGNFSLGKNEIRSKKDLATFRRVLEKN